MSGASALALALLAHSTIHHAAASPITDTRSHRPCTTFTIPVPVTAQSHIWDYVRVDSNIDAVSYAVDIDTWDNPTIFERMIKNITVSKTYDIHAQLCVPANGSKKSYLQLASHGGGFDSRYWDAQVEPEEHSYVDAALEEGYSILTYDGLGCGESSKPNAYTDVQAPVAIEILRGISELVRSGKISNYASNSIAFDKIIHIGHSYGSFFSYVFTSLYPSLSDAAVLTGFIPGKQMAATKTTGGDFHFAPEADPKKYADFSSGYIATGTKSAFQSQFFSSRVNESTDIGGFDPKLLDYGWSISQPITVPQFPSIEVLLATTPSAPEYTGPVQFVAGEFDFEVCAGDCRNAYNISQIQGMYPKSNGVDIYLRPGTGHGLPLHNDARAGFQVTFDWLEKNGF